MLTSLLIVWYLLSLFEFWSPLLFPSPTRTLIYAIENMDFVVASIQQSLMLFLTVLAISSVISLTVGSLASQSKAFKGVLETLVSLICPVPGISLLPFAMLWFGLGYKPILFISVIGSLPVYILSIMNGFNTVPKILVDVGKLYGMNKAKLIRYIYIPAALPSIMTGFRAVWGIAWRTIIGAEIVYGAMSQGAGLGWLICMNRYELNPNGMAVGILSIAIIGLIVEYLFFAKIEKMTVKKWGMKI